MQPAKAATAAVVKCLSATGIDRFDGAELESVLSIQRRVSRREVKMAGSTSAETIREMLKVVEQATKSVPINEWSPV